MKDRTIRFQCPACERRLKMPEPRPGKTIVCPKCNCQFKVDPRLGPVMVQGGRNEIFGPPVDQALVDDRSLARDFNPHAFDDIDHLINAVEDDQVQPRPTKKPRTPVTQTPVKNRPTRSKRRRRGDREKKSRREKVVDTANKWAQEKVTRTKTDEKFQRNGIGLLILSVGLAVLPFVGADVEGLQAILPYVPMVGLATAFSGSFMLAWSMRRGNLRAVIWSGVWFVLIGLLCLGGYAYQTSITGTPRAGIEGGAENADSMDEPEAADKLLIDPDSLDNNAAARFKPSKHIRPLADDKRPAAAAEPVEKPAAIRQPSTAETESGAGDADAEDTVRESRLRPSELKTDRNKRPKPAPGKELESELKTAKAISLNNEKRNRLLQRISRVLNKGYVNRDVVQSPDDLRERFVVSEVAGKATVYGIAYYFDGPVSGFDTAYPENRPDSSFDLIVPIIDAPEFRDSITAIDSESQITAVNLNIDVSEGVVGLQAIFRTPGDSGKPKISKWIGRSTDHPVTIEADGHRVHGVVTYKQQLKTVGVALVLSNSSELK